MRMIKQSDDLYELMLWGNETRMTVQAKNFQEAKLKYCNNMINILKQECGINEGDIPMPEVKPVKVDMSDEDIKELKDLLKKSPVTLLPNNNYNDENSQGWYHVDANDDWLGISIHRKLWLDTLHTGGGTSAFYDENSKLWLIPTKSIRFLHPYKEKNNEN